VAERVRAVLRDQGLADDDSTPELLRFRGGSQAFRITGGWLSPARWFPRAAIVSLTPAPGGGVNVQLHAEEQMGVGVLDRRMKRKYTEVLEGLADGLGAGIGGQEKSPPDEPPEESPAATRPRP
jgi:hypothetical protein